MRVWVATQYALLNYKLELKVEIEERERERPRERGENVEMENGEWRKVERAHKMDGNVAILPSFYVRRHCHKLIGRCF